MDELKRQYQRWIEADDSGRDDDADHACGAVFEELRQDPLPAADFTARTLAAVAEATTRDRQRARQARRAGVAGGGAAAGIAVYFGGAWALSAMSTVLIAAVDLFVRVTVRVASGMESGSDLWALLASLGHALAAFVADPSVTAVILAMQGIAMAALLALHRLLGSDRESLK